MSVSRRYLGLQREVGPQIKSPFFNLQNFLYCKICTLFLNDEFAEEVASIQWEFGFMYFALFFRRTCGCALHRYALSACVNHAHAHRQPIK